MSDDPPVLAHAVREGVFIQGLYSVVGRQSEFEIEHLRHQCEDQGHGKAKQKGAAVAKTSDGSKVGSSSALSFPGGDLARAIQEKLRSKLDPKKEGLVAGAEKGKTVNFALVESQKLGAAATAPERQVFPTSSFAGPGFYDSPWTNKFTASHSPGALNRWNEQRADPCQYQVQHSLVLNRHPAWDFNQRPRHKSRKRPQSVGDRDSEGDADSSPASPEHTGGRDLGSSFLTGVDLSEELDADQVRAARRSPSSGSVARQQGNTYLAKAVPRGPLGKIGRRHVTMQEVSYPAEDLNVQDIKGQPKLRYPEWDFGKDKGRGPLMKKQDHIMPPGKYDVNYGPVTGKVKIGIPFDSALARSATTGQLGHFAPVGALQTDEKRFPGGCLPDRSRTKDVCRDRVTNVNDFQRELARPNLPPASQEYHDTEDPVACERTLRQQMTYDADHADWYVTSRRDIAPGYAKMLSRGKEAVQGNRALQTDLGVRGSVGIGFTQTTGQATCSVERLEGRKSSDAYTRPDIGPVFDHYTEFQPLSVKNNFNHGYAPVHGSGPRYNPKFSHLQKPLVGGAFKREVSCPGFSKQASIRGPKVLRQSRAYEALPGWNEELQGGS